MEDTLYCLVRHKGYRIAVEMAATGLFEYYIYKGDSILNAIFKEDFSSGERALDCAKEVVDKLAGY